MGQFKTKFLVFHFILIVSTCWNRDRLIVGESAGLVIKRLQVQILGGVVGELYSPESTLRALIWCLFHPHVTAVACKRPWSFCKKCKWQVTPNHIHL